MFADELVVQKAARSCSDLDIVERRGKCDGWLIFQTVAAKLELFLKLVHTRTLLFLFDDAFYIVWSYLTVGTKQLAESLSESADISTVLLIFHSFVTPLIGFLLDRTNRHKLVLQLSLSACSATVFLFQISLPMPEILNHLNQTRSTSVIDNTAAVSVIFLKFIQSTRVFLLLTGALVYLLFDSLNIVSADRIRRDEDQCGLSAVIVNATILVVYHIARFYTSLPTDRFQNGGIYVLALLVLHMIIILSLMKTTNMDYDWRSHSSDPWRQLVSALVAANVWAYFVCAMTMGACWGTYISLGSTQMERMNTTSQVIDLAGTVRHYSGIPFVYASSWMVQKITPVRLLQLTLVFYSIRLIGYATITNPSLYIPLESIEGMSHKITMETIDRINYRVFPTEMFFTMHTVVDAVVFNGGRLIGLQVANSICSIYGLSFTFKVFGYLALAASVCYALLNCLLSPLGAHRRPDGTRLDRVRAAPGADCGQFSSRTDLCSYSQSDYLQLDLLDRSRSNTRLSGPLDPVE